MASSKVRRSQDAVETSLDTAQAVGKRVWDDVSAWVTDRRRQVEALVAHAPQLPTGLRERAERVRLDIEVRRSRLLTSLEARATWLADTVTRRLNGASREEMAGLSIRIRELEQRLIALGSQPAPGGSLSAMDSQEGSHLDSGFMTSGE